MNKGQSSILVIGDGPVTRLEECTWNESRRISTLFWKALFSSEVPSTLEILHIAVTYSPNPNFSISRVVSGPCALQRDPSVPEAHELISRNLLEELLGGGSKAGCNSEALSFKSANLGKSELFLKSLCFVLAYAGLQERKAAK